MAKKIEFKKVKMSYTDKGKGRVVVLLHGFLGSKLLWEEYVKVLSKHFRVIAIDLPGHGDTPALGYYHSMEMLAQSVKAVLDGLGVRKYLIAGHSMGGYTALAFAELFPDNVRGLCLVHSTSHADSDEKIKERDLLIKMIKKNHKKIVSEMILSHFTIEKNKNNSIKIKTATTIASDTSQHSIVNSLEGMKERKNREMILKFAAYPILFVVGKKDTIINIDSIFSQIGVCKFPTVIMMENYGHLGFYESPKEVIPELILFANRCFRTKN